ncbi:Uncharacterised protein [Mycobacteroides abscessus subsp. abscessus]|nr:Uncharacterised protein [Mycobacteroides abscessus subsp. abscessus]
MSGRLAFASGPLAITAVRAVNCEPSAVCAVHSALSSSNSRPVTFTPNRMKRDSEYLSTIVLM